MISLYDILEAANGQLFGEPAAQIFTDFCLDSRNARESQLFVAMKTDQGDSHQYIAEAIRNGASGVICNRPPECDTQGVSVALTRDVPGALMRWAHYVLGKQGIHVIGVAGSWGKSVAVEAIAQILGPHYDIYRDNADYSGPLSVPLALAKLSPEHKLVVLKLAATRPGEMAEMVQAIQPDVGLVTHIGHAHVDRFSSLQHIAQEEGKLVEYLSPTGLAVLNYDNDLVRELPTRGRSMTFGMERFGADLMAYNIVAGPNGTGFDLRYGSNRYLGRWVPLLGKHHIYSILAALVVGLHYEVPLEEALKVLTNLNPLPGRMNPLVGRNDSLLVDDTYDANPESTLAALDWLQAVKDEGQRAIFMMGDMDNLGTYSQFGHRMIGQRAAEVADLIVTNGTEAALIGRAALDQGLDPSRVQTTYNAQDAVAALKEGFTITPDDIILVKGAPSARMERVVENLLKDNQDSQQLVRQQAAWRPHTLFQPSRPSWVEIDTDALAGNVRAIKKIIGPKVRLMAVVKANGYGHGAVTTAQTALLNGAESVAVASVSEALELREAGIEVPILVLSYTPTYLIHQATRHNLAVSVYDLEMARAYNQIARETGSRLLIHVKIDSGMGRLGVLPAEAAAFFRHLTTLPNLEIEGIYTHFSMADEDPSYTAEQLNTFRGVVRPLRASGMNFKYVHAANSAATLTLKDSHFNMVRVGGALYGLRTVELPPEFKPVMSWKTVIAQVKTLPPGHPVSYGNTYRTQREEQIAVIPVGYSDGFRRSPTNWTEVLVHGQPASVVGRVGMEKSMINVSGIPGVSIGDEVVLLGRQGDAAITADDIAARLGTNNHEVVCTILPRVPRR